FLSADRVSVTASPVFTSARAFASPLMVTLASLAKSTETSGATVPSFFFCASRVILPAVASSDLTFPAAVGTPGFFSLAPTATAAETPAARNTADRTATAVRNSFGIGTNLRWESGRNGLRSGYGVGWQVLGWDGAAVGLPVYQAESRPPAGQT